MWEPQRLTTLWASMAWYRISLPLPYLYSREKNLFWEANSCLAGPKMFRFLWNIKVHYRVPKNPLMIPILSQWIQSTRYFSELHFVFILSSKAKSHKYYLPFRFLDYNLRSCRFESWERISSTHCIGAIWDTNQCECYGGENILWHLPGIEALFLGRADPTLIHTPTELPRLLTDRLIKLSTSWEATSFSAAKECPQLLWNPRVHYRVHKAHHWARLIQSIQPHYISLRFFLTPSSHPHLCLSIGLFLSVHQNPVGSPLLLMRVTCPVHLIILDLKILILCGEEYKLWCSLLYSFLHLLLFHRSRDSVVGMATGYGLDDRGIRVLVPVGSRIFTSPSRPNRLWGPPNLLSNGYRG
jgi:hypothetical protein